MPRYRPRIQKAPLRTSFTVFPGQNERAIGALVIEIFLPFIAYYTIEGVMCSIKATERKCLDWRMKARLYRTALGGLFRHGSKRSVL